MPVLPLEMVSREYLSNHGLPVRTWRPRLELYLPTRTGRWLPQRFLVDTGAPLSVVPYSFWSPNDIDWSWMGDRLSDGGAMSAGPLLWNGNPCDLGLTQALLIDPVSRFRFGLYSLLAKFVQRPPASS